MRIPLLLFLFVVFGSKPVQASGSLDAHLITFYQLLSGPAGTRDWDKFRTLCVPEASFNAVTYLEDGSPNPLIGSIDDYIDNSAPFFLENGFQVKEIRRKTQIYGNVAQVFSTYEASFQLAGNEADITQRGVYSFQLIRTGEGWRFLHVFWNVESAFDPLPEEHLPPNNRPVATRATPNRSIASTSPTSKEKLPKAKPGEYLYKPGEIDLPPKYPGGEEALKNYLKDHIQPTGESFFRRPDGSTWISVQFIVNQKGELEQFQVVGATEPMTIQQLQAIAEMPNWEPGKLQDQPVRVLYSLSIPIDP